MPDGVSWDDINLENGKTGMQMNIERYGQSKAMNVIQAQEYARLYHTHGKGIVSLSLHPGALSTGLQKNAPRWFNAIFSVLRREPRFGALTELFAGIRLFEKEKSKCSKMEVGMVDMFFPLEYLGLAVRIFSMGYYTERLVPDCGLCVKRWSKIFYDL